MKLFRFLTRPRVFLVLFWLAAGITAPIFAWETNSGWDTEVYWTAMQSIAHGGDPYTEGIAAQQAFVAHPHAAHAHPPMTYVYSPMTLPVLRVLGHVPVRWLAAGYYAAYAAGFLLLLWAVAKMALPQERKLIVFLLPAAAYFPGLLNDDVILSGNIVYILYGLVFAAAVAGWTRNRWHWYYVAVLAASCFKAPLLSLLALPAFYGERQWGRAVATGVAGVGLFACQALLWPRLFAEYLTAVNLQFVYNSDFGFGPAGILGHALRSAGLPYAKASQLLYLAFAVAVVVVLALTRRRCGARFTWLPVVLVGTILLNPRVKEYDVATLTIPLVLIAWRFFRAARAYVLEREQKQNPHLVWSAASRNETAYAAPSFGWTEMVSVAAIFGWFLVINMFADGDTWKPLELGILLVSFGAGTWTALAQRRGGALDSVDERRDSRPCDEAGSLMA